MFWKILPYSIREKLEAPYRLDARLAIKNVLWEKGENRLRVLDDGCGDCFAKSWFNGHEYTGIDASDYGVNAVGDVERIDFENEHFDFALCLEVLEHVKRPDEAVRELNRVLKKGGHAVISTPLLSAGFHSDFRRWSPPGLQIMLENAGFKTISITPIGGYCRMLGFQISKISYWIKKPQKKIFWPLYYLIKIPVGLVFQILIPLILFYLDRLDREKHDTSGYISIISK